MSVRLKHGIIAAAKRIEVLRALEGIVADGKAYERIEADTAERQWREAYSEDAPHGHTQPTMDE